MTAGELVDEVDAGIEELHVDKVLSLTIGTRSILVVGLACHIVKVFAS